MQVFKRPQFLRDLAEELTWLKDKAGADVAEAWYQSLNDTIHFLAQHPFVGRVRKDLSPPCIRSWRMSGFPRWLLFYTVPVVLRPTSPAKLQRRKENCSPCFIRADPWSYLLNRKFVTSQSCMM